jgi:hypothetical protein
VCFSADDALLKRLPHLSPPVDVAPMLPYRSGSLVCVPCAATIVNVKVEPFPSVDSAQISPPCALTRSCTCDCHGRQGRVSTMAVWANDIESVGALSTDCRVTAQIFSP